MNLDELYFKDNFTKEGEKVNLEVNQLTAECITSKNNTFSLDSEGNLSVNSIHTVRSGSGDLSFDTIYPVGSIYMSVNPTKPDTLFGGAWERIEDCFLLAGGTQFYAGTTGGEARVTLSTSNIPEHNHSIPSLSGSTSYNGNHTHPIRGISSRVSGSWNGVVASASCSDTAWNGMDGSGDHNHSVSTNPSSTGYAGGNSSHNNMPPYLAVYMWKRVL